MVDTTPPVAPTITARPPFPASGIITFGWTTEPGAFSRWQIIGAGGAVVIGPSDTPLNSVSIANLADGAYSFQVLQIDAAGNASATTSEPFTVTNPLAPGQTAANPRVQPEFLLPSQNAARLRPKAGKTVPTRRPVLRWHKGPRGTRLYNVQIFKVVKKRRGANPTVKKVYSGFPSQAPAARSQVEDAAGHLLRLARLALHRHPLHTEAPRHQQLLRGQGLGAEEEGRAGGRPAQGRPAARPVGTPPPGAAPGTGVY